MCSFLVYLNSLGLKVKNLDQILKYLVRRGPDGTNKYQDDTMTFIHCLLHITGKKIYQPFVYTKNKSNIVALFNGEIYNYHQFGNFSTDGECLIPAYRKYGNQFVKYLDGEFAIVLVDYTRNIIILSSDIFATKPIYYYNQDEVFITSSYASGVIEILKQNKILTNSLDLPEIRKIPANQTLILNATTFEILHQQEIYHFDLRQFKTTYQDWIQAFNRAIKKRVDHTGNYSDENH